jgi:hypothetical protein
VIGWIGKEYDELYRYIPFLIGWIGKEYDDLYRHIPFLS